MFVSLPEGEPALEPARDPALPDGEIVRAKFSPSPRLVLLVGSLIFNKVIILIIFKLISSSKCVRRHKEN